MFSAAAAILFELEFLGCIEFIACCDVVLRFTHRTHQSKEFSLFLFCHTMTYYTACTVVLQEGYSKKLVSYYRFDDFLRKQRLARITWVDVVALVDIRLFAFTKSIQTRVVGICKRQMLAFGKLYC